MEEQVSSNALVKEYYLPKMAERSLEHLNHKFWPFEKLNVCSLGGRSLERDYLIKAKAEPQLLIHNPTRVQVLRQWSRLPEYNSHIVSNTILKPPLVQFGCDIWIDMRVSEINKSLRDYMIGWLRMTNLPHLYVAYAEPWRCWRSTSFSWKFQCEASIVAYGPHTDDE